jgi:integrase/recombinase XerD
MTTVTPSTALATIQPAFTDPERLALAGYLAGYRGLTRDAYTLDLRQFTTWCRVRSLVLFAEAANRLSHMLSARYERSRGRLEPVSDSMPGRPARGTRPRSGHG